MDFILCGCTVAGFIVSSQEIFVEYIYYSYLSLKEKLLKVFLVYLPKEVSFQKRVQKTPILFSLYALDWINLLSAGLLFSKSFNFIPQYHLISLAYFP